MPQPPEIKNIKVQILLNGGHQCTLYLPSDAPLLQELFTSLTSRSQNQAHGLAKLFQIPLDGGRSSLCFPGENLIGLVTEPPVFLQAPEEKSEATSFLASQYVQIDNFLYQDEKDRLLAYTWQQESAFVGTSTTNDSHHAGYRNSLVLYSFPEFHELIIARIQSILPNVLNQLRIPLFSSSQIEAQLTAHNDGNYYKVHNDNGSPDTATRELTYVYYFYQEPKPFSGGELRLYDSKIENNYYVKAESFKTIEPRNNSIVFFLSRYLHEVLPVSCPSKAFADSRFTINGWVRR